MAGAIDKIKAKVENVLHKDKDTTHTDATTGTHTGAHTGTTGTHTTGSGLTGSHAGTTGTHTTGSGLTGSSHSKFFPAPILVAYTNTSRRPHWSSQLARCQQG